VKNFILNTVRVVLFMIVVSPLINVLSLLFLTGDAATFHMSLFKLMGMSLAVEIVSSVVITMSWFVKPCQRRYGRWLQHLGTAQYLAGCYLAEDNPRTFVTLPLTPINQ
jgi:hypothetical protein